MVVDSVYMNLVVPVDPDVQEDHFVHSGLVLPVHLVVLVVPVVPEVLDYHHGPGYLACQDGLAVPVVPVGLQAHYFIRWNTYFLIIIMSK